MLYEADLLNYPDPDWPVDPPKERDIDDWEEEERAETQRVTQGAVDVDWDDDRDGIQ